MYNARRSCVGMFDFFYSISVYNIRGRHAHAVRCDPTKRNNEIKKWKERERENKKMELKEHTWRVTRKGKKNGGESKSQLTWKVRAGKESSTTKQKTPSLCRRNCASVARKVSREGADPFCLHGCCCCCSRGGGRCIIGFYKNLFTLSYDSIYSSFRFDKNFLYCIT